MLVVLVSMKQVGIQNGIYMVYKAPYREMWTSDQLAMRFLHTLSLHTFHHPTSYPMKLGHHDMPCRSDL